MGDTVTKLIQLYTIDEQTKKAKFVERFEANGKTYLIEERISTQRWKAWRKIQVPLMFGVTIDVVFKRIKEAYTLLNKKESEIIEAGIILHNLMTTIKDIDDESRVPDVVQLCALFINTPEEDRRTISESQIREKCRDWEDAGVDIQSFFLFAINSIPNFQPLYEQLTQNISPTN